MDSSSDLITCGKYSSEVPLYMTDRVRQPVYLLRDVLSWRVLLMTYWFYGGEFNQIPVLSVAKKWQLLSLFHLYNSEAAQCHLPMNRDWIPLCSRFVVNVVIDGKEIESNPVIIRFIFITLSILIISNAILIWKITIRYEWNLMRWYKKKWNGTFYTQ